MAAQPTRASDTPSTSLRLPAFPNYTQVRSRVPLAIWQGCRIASVVIALSLAGICFIRPSVGLFIFWQLIVPVLPLVFVVAPGLWRNICPMAALNQTPRLFSFTKGLSLPAWLQEYGYVLGAALFIAAVSARKIVFNDNGMALGLLLLVALALALIMGTLFKGKSGWCSSICPLLPVQRVYGQTPFAQVPNSYCRPCVSCTKHCYDYNPPIASLLDLQDDNPRHGDYRRLFVGAFPGLILAYFLVENPPAISITGLYLQFAAYLLCSIGSFYALQTFAKVSAHMVTAVYSVAAFNLYYWFSIPQVVHEITGASAPPVARWAAQAAIGGLAVVWLVRTYHKEQLFTSQIAPAALADSGRRVAAPLPLAAQTELRVTFLPEERRVTAAPNASLLEVIEGCGMRIEAGCRMGMCGADPVAIRSGAEYLSPIDVDERNTLERLGLAATTRMACCARVQGPVSLSLTPERPAQPRPSSMRGLDFDPRITRIVIIGNGIAGVTAADHIRRRHPRCEIHLVTREKYHLYNRMGISRLIYGRSAMQGLFLLPEAWYDEHQITCWLNTWAHSLNPQAHQVTLATGDVLSYDRLVLATGSSSIVPAIGNFGLPGSFQLREADDAMEMRSFAQGHTCRHAVIAGSGLLGLEAAYALHTLGMQVTVLERSDRIMPRQLNRRSSTLLKSHLEDLGIIVREQAEPAELMGSDRVRRVTLTDGEQLPCDLFLVCTGIKPNIALARDAQLRVQRGVIVDDELRTSDPAIFAVGDVAEYRGQVYGLWPVAVRQAEIAAINALGGHTSFERNIAATILKVAGIDLTSIGRFEPDPGDQTIVLEDREKRSYRALIIAPDDTIAGAILLGYPHEAALVTAAISKGLQTTPFLEALRAGDWYALSDRMSQERNRNA